MALKDAKLAAHDPGWASYATALLIVAACTAVNWILARWLAVTDLAMMYLLGVVVAATYLPVSASIASAILAFVCFDFFFVPPAFTLHFADNQHLVTGLILLTVGLITSALAGEMRRQTRAATQAAITAREEQLRSSLLTSISHDLRTPLAVIAGSASTLRENRDRLSADQQDELLQTIFDRARGMSVEVSDVLEMTQLSMGTVRLNLQWYPLEELIGAAIERCKEKLALHVVSIDAPADMPLVRVDAVLFEKLLVNLLENAARHTPRASHVRLVVARSSSALQLRIEDDGPGLPEPTAERLFEKFEHGVAEGATAGAGLGLTICRTIAQLHGIGITGENRAEGGACFVITLPHIQEPGSCPESP
jgi:two-component system sensor histidine kinase KdpD